MSEEDEAADAPLITDNEDDIVQQSVRSDVQENDLTSPSAFIWALTFAAGISGVLFGYECVHSFLPPSSNVDHLLAPV